ncbi:MAG: 3'-5' exonuclease [Bacteroidales bacterium]|jgi:predicted PolB exonuclease-like 3'-5' exonuclease|nr:3'-5' exonuclease [Bacteroidales bacterium]
MPENIRPEDILFLDIETVPAVPSFDMLEEHMKELWEKKSAQFRTGEQTAGTVYDRAAIYAEFGKIICISAGVFTGRDPFRFRLKSFFGDDEKEILSDFSLMLNRFARSRESQLCAHNGKEFDYPYLARRMVINRLVIPEMLNIAGKKPWEVKLLDTMELWKFGDFRSFVSLDLLTSVLGLPSPKDDIRGSEVGEVYWNSHDITRIVTYCEKDVLAVARILLRLMNLGEIDDDGVESVTNS